MRVAHKVPPSSFIKNSSHRHASFEESYLRKAEKSHVFLPTGDSREERVLFPRRLSEISNGKEFNQEGFDQGQQSPNEAFPQ